MNIDEAIEKLTEIKQIHGNIDIVLMKGVDNKNRIVSKPVEFLGVKKIPKTILLF